ncbi:MAG: HD domain-containing protein [Thermoplasmata archaeon]|nr:HD domain-containing protein [Thermoplasmata archaeon]
MPRRAGPRARKSIFDPVHGVLTFEGAPLELIGDPAFQRLWGIRQTGLAHLVFPGANHTRLEHSLGTYWVARTMAEALSLGRPEAQLVMAGGLLHDLGHPPLSHTLDGPMEEALGVSHEQRSRQIVLGSADPLASAEVAASEIPTILERHSLSPKIVADLIDPPSRGEKRPLLRSMLHGTIDADRIDYLQRDAYYTGVAHGAIDAIRLLDTIELASGRIAFAEKGRHAVEGFLVGRSLMYSTVYYHKTVRAAEVMAQAAVERLPGYPGTARELLAGADGDLFARLAREGGRPAEMARALRERHLYRRVHAWRSISHSALRRFRRLRDSPPARRAAERAVAERLGAVDGSVLLDLSGLVERDAERQDGLEIGVVVDGKITFPFASRGHWLARMLHPGAPWPVAVYAARRHESELRRLLVRDPDLFG